MAVKENKGYKNSMFVDLFFEDESAEENDIALYNALHKEPLPKGTKIQKIRIDDVLYMNFKNDISFGVGGKIMVFGEHQSTINENMPLRSLMYIGRAYEQLVPIRERYKKKQTYLPKPEFYTFYNGQEHWAREKVLKLSEAYEVQDDKPMLELTVKVININPAENHELLDKCPVLKEYGQFVDMVRKFQKMSDSDAYKHAVETCIRQGILVDYLEKKGSEVINMLIAEYDYDLDIEVQREEAYTEGLEKGTELGKELGKELGRQETFEELIKKKLAKGKSPSEIADALEKPLEDVEKIILKLKESVVE